MWGCLGLGTAEEAGAGDSLEAVTPASCPLQNSFESKDGTGSAHAGLAPAAAAAYYPYEPALGQYTYDR